MADVEALGQRVGSHRVALVTALAGSAMLAVGVTKTQPPGTPRSERLGRENEVRIVDGSDPGSKAPVTLVSPTTTCVGKLGRQRWIEAAATAEWIELRELSGCPAATSAEPQVAIFGDHPALQMTALSDEKRVDGKKVEMLFDDGSAKRFEVRTAVPGTDVEAVAAAAPADFGAARLEIRRGGKVLLERPTALTPGGALDLGGGVWLLAFKTWEHASIVAVEASSARLVTEEPASSAAPATPAKPATPSVPVEVTATDPACTTEPASAKPALSALPASAGRVRLKVLGRGELCQGKWAATRTGDQITVLPSPAPDPTPCGTCSVTLTLSPLPAGTWHVSLDGATLDISNR